MYKCPMCRKDGMTLYMGFQFGKYICKDCGYVGSLVIEEYKKNSEIEKKKGKNIKYFDKWAKSYDRFIFGWWMRGVQDKLVSMLELKSRSKVLDVGCGTGYLIMQIAKKVKKGKVIGIDFSSGMVEQAKRKLIQIKNVEVKQADVWKIPYKSSTFDYVLNTEALHHFVGPEKALKEISRVMKKNGVVAIADVNFPPLAVFNFLFKLEPGFVRMYSEKEMKSLLKKAGLKVVKQKRVSLFALLTIARKN